MSGTHAGDEAFGLAEVFPAARMRKAPIIGSPPDRELHSGVRVAICVATYRRPRMLHSLLESLGRLTFEPHLRPVISLVVVDNDPGGPAGDVVRSVDAGYPYPITYLVEARRGIANARNRAVAVALQQDSDFVAFIDDDEVAHSGWLNALLKVQREYAADVAAGPVAPRFAPDVPAWIASGGFFEPPRRRTGARVLVPSTNNVLISADLLLDRPEPFEPSFGLSGIDDTHFFLRVGLAGARMVWADQAVVEEFIPASRARPAWIVRRAFRVGNGYVRCVRALLPARSWVVPRLAGASARILYGLVMLPLAVVRGRAAAVHALRTAANGIGAIAALLGVHHEEYTRIHGE